MDINDLEKEINLNADANLTDEQIRARNKKYIEEVVKTYEAPGAIIHPPLPPLSSEMAIIEQRANERGTFNDDSKNYSPTLPKVKIPSDFVDVIDVSKLDFVKKYDPNDFFIKATLDVNGKKAIQERIAKEYDSPFQVIDGKRHYAVYYFNQEAWCLELFFEAIGWDAKIVEAVMHKDNASLRSQIVGYGFPKLALAARGKK